ncbi:hypothetical protein DFH94DRAFT_685147 [Russula ochroleuca]|uniref:Uncharacterized protein n=1 Tax=Russula ochroleuca TaxID=152965 RepID=A0A9P5JYN1_9AGAM|nr:hypothetical protein DFH94DRAFT_685147 [Russula ochroleuca]
MLDILRLIPKLNVCLMAACHAKNAKVDFRCTAGGYSHTYFDTDGIPLGILSEFPSNSNIACAASLAFEEANTLWDLLGFYSSASGQGTNTITPLVSIHGVDEDTADDIDQDTEDAKTDCHLLQAALDSSQLLSEIDGHTQARLDECTYAAACLGIADREAIDALPEEDQETQHALMEHVLEILLEHQSEEEASAVRIAQARTGNNPAKEGNDDSEQGAQPHTPTAATSQDSERRQLAKKINDIIKASMAVPSGGSTGLNCHARWNTDKLAAGSTLPADGTVTTTGNTANVQATTRKAAQSIVNQQASAFAQLKNADTLASAKVSLLAPSLTSLLALLSSMIK